MAASASDAPSRTDGESQVRRSSPKIPPAPEVPEIEGFDVDLGTRSSISRLSRGVSMPPPVATVGRYDVLGRIAVGGMAEIYLAQERSSGGGTRLVILKVLRQHMENDEELDAMFLREGSVAMQLSHPNICSTYEFGKIGGHYFMAMEYVDGATVRQILVALAKRKEAMPVAYAVAIFARIAAALDYAHRAKDSRRRQLGLVHRDVTPHNVMVRGDGVVKLLDFGVAQVAASEHESRSDAVKGKFGYLSPEQTVAKPLDGRSDVFALGVCLYEVLTMKRLYKRGSQFETFKAILQDPVPSIRDVDDSLPEDLDAIVQKALAKKPSERFQTAGDMQQALEEWLADQRQVVNATRLAGLMQTLFGDELEAGPTLVADETVIRRLAPLQEEGEKVLSARPPPMRADTVQPTTGEGSVVTGTDMTSAMPAQRNRAIAIGAIGAMLIAGIGVAVGMAARGSDAETESTGPAASAPPGDAQEAEAEEPTMAAVPVPVEEESAEDEVEDEDSEAALAETEEGSEETEEAEVEEAEMAAPSPMRRRRRGSRMRPGFVADPGF